MYISGFAYSGFEWYVSERGQTCDSLCSNIGGENLEEDANDVILDDDCTIVEHFMPAGRTSPDIRSTYYQFGYWYSFDDIEYYCVNTAGTFPGAGTRSGESSNDPDRYIVCPCFSALSKYFKHFQTNEKYF